MKSWKLMLAVGAVLGGCLVFLCGCPGGQDPDDPYTPSPPADDGLLFDSTDPADAAKAIGMNDGFVSAEWVSIDGSSYATLPTNYQYGHGIHSGFGVTSVREGYRLLELSNGMARLPSETGYVDRFENGYNKGFDNDSLPAGFPHCEPGASNPGDAHDGIGLKVTIEVPDGVAGFKVDFRYFTSDYPQYLQTAYVDQAAGLLTSSSGRATGVNFLLDQYGNPVYSSSLILTYGDELIDGTADLVDTGYYKETTDTDRGAASGWLTATVTRGAATFADGDTLEIVFAIWDSGDYYCDSSLLLDNFRWVPE